MSMVYFVVLLLPVMVVVVVVEEEEAKMRAESALRLLRWACSKAGVGGATPQSRLGIFVLLWFGGAGVVGVAVMLEISIASKRRCMFSERGGGEK